MTTIKKHSYYDSDRVRQAELRARRKEQGWKRVSIWLSPEQVDSLETLGGESWLGRTVKELLTGAVSERQQPVKQAALFVGAEPLPDTVNKSLSDTANKPLSDNDLDKGRPQGKTTLSTDTKPLPDTANKSVSDNGESLPDNRAELAKLGHALLRTGLTKAAVAAHFNRIGATPNRIPKIKGTKPRTDSAATWTVKSISQFLLRDYPEA